MEAMLPQPGRRWVAGRVVHCARFCSRRQLAGRSRWFSGKGRSRSHK